MGFAVCDFRGFGCLVICVLVFGVWLLGLVQDGILWCLLFLGFSCLEVGFGLCILVVVLFPGCYIWDFLHLMIVGFGVLGNLLFWVAVRSCIVVRRIFLNFAAFRGSCLPGCFQG